MNILMVTNLYTPNVGGVTRSIMHFTEEYRKRGHRVIVVAPHFENEPEGEEDVIRVPAIENFNNTDFSVAFPVPGFLLTKLKEDFVPDIIHAHHPFLLGSAAVRLATYFDAPLVYTYHTMYEYYTHYTPVESERLQQFAIKLAVGYCNLCDRVIAPSESVKRILRDRGVVSQIEAVPTGVYVEEFSEGDGKGFREEQDIPEYAFLMGHLGRLEPEKNLGFLSEAVSRFMEKNEKAHFVVIGNGTSRDEMAEHFEKKGLRDRLHLGGIMKGQQLVDAYHAMDVFVFASQSETQGMVLTEAMATGTPVVAVDAVGAREVVKDTENGRLLPEEDAEAFADALEWIQNRDDEEIEFIRKNCRQTAQKFSMENSVNRLIEIYEQAKEESAKDKPESDTSWHWAMDQLQTEWDLLKNAVKSAWYTFETPTEEMLETERQHGKKV